MWLASVRYLQEEEMVLENEIESFQNTIGTYQSKVSS